MPQDVATQDKLGRSIPRVQIHKGDKDINGVARSLGLVGEMDTVLVIDLCLSTRKRHEGALVDEDNIVAQYGADNGHPRRLIKVIQKSVLGGLKGWDFHVESPVAAFSQDIEAIGELPRQVAILDRSHHCFVVFYASRVALADLLRSQTVFGIHVSGRLLFTLFCCSACTLCCFCSAVCFRRFSSLGFAFFVVGLGSLGWRGNFCIGRNGFCNHGLRFLRIQIIVL
mmetsp:Transcript_22209/g.55001  ORF Transcript_22209/g.55001 Transcript_22209/m.55001 type:complete len:226 (+) Transcript_22209:1396-2073(+)